MRRADGTGDEQAVIKGWAPGVSPDGKWMILDDDNPATSSSDVFLVAMPADTASERKAIIGSGKNEGSPRISPSGNYLAYESDESGRDEIYLTRFPSADGKWQASVAGGTRPHWDPAGGRLYFTSDTALMEVDVTETPELRLGNPRQLFLLDDARVFMGRTASYDVERGGKRFIMSYNASSAVASPRLKLVVVENWPTEFRKSAKK
jgi:dipeptidyl aminopeptidase/acylaminoacyl peptidase